MGRIIIEAPLLEKLRALTQAVELCDASGNPFGKFVPEAEEPRTYPVPIQVTEEELDRRESSNEKIYTTAEVLAYLEKR